MLFTEAWERSTGFRYFLRRHIVWPIVCFRGGGNINVGVSIAGCVYLVALAKALDDVQVGAGRFHEAVFQQPAVRLRVGVALSQHIFQGRLEETNSRQHWQLKQDTQMHISDNITQNVNTNQIVQEAKEVEFCMFPPYAVILYLICLICSWVEDNGRVHFKCCMGDPEIIRQ